jgi:hypothetical protein
MYVHVHCEFVFCVCGKATPLNPACVWGCAEHKITASHRPFSMHFYEMAAQATSWSSRQNFQRLYNYQYGLDRDVYMYYHYSLLEISYFFMSITSRHCSFALVLAVLRLITIAGHKSKCNYCARCAHVP